MQFLLAQVTFFISPTTSIDTISQIEDYMRKNNIEDINEIVGKVEMN